jgi:hypothetical protein
VRLLLNGAMPSDVLFHVAVLRLRGRFICVVLFRRRLAS